MKFIEKSIENVQNKTSIFFDKNGCEVSQKDTMKTRTYAKLLTVDSKEKEQPSKQLFYIKTYQSIPFDPAGPYGAREREVETKMQEVSKKVFDDYLVYLKTRNTLFLTRARRGLTND